MKVKEGTNKAIAVNSVILYGRLLITSICGFFTTRFALQALGVVDYGLFAVLGGIIALIDVANAVMINTTTRFMTVALGRGDEDEMNQQFNINLRVHLYTAIFSLIMALTVGVWYIYNFLNYDGPISNAIIVFLFSVIGADISMLGVPYHGLLSAKENFLISSIPAVVSSLLKLIVSFLLVYCFTHKLFIYAGTQCILTVYPVIVYVLFCRKNYYTIVKFDRVKDKSMYKKVLGFSGWTLYGTAASMAKNQGAAIVINVFFSTVMNAALGIANTLNGLINAFAQNLSQPMFPQITKSYASGDMNRCKQLLCMTTKFSYLLVFLVSSPFLIDAEWVLSLWLKEVPPMASKFTCLLIIDLLVSSFNAGVSTVIKADGAIWSYEFFGNTLRLIAVFISFFILKGGAPAETLLYVYIIVSFVVVVINQFILHRVTKIDNMVLIKGSYLPSVIVTVSFVPILFLKMELAPVLRVILGFLYAILLVWFIGLNVKERQYAKNMIISVINTVKRR